MKILLGKKGKGKWGPLERKGKESEPVGFANGKLVKLMELNIDSEQHSQSMPLPPKSSSGLLKIPTATQHKK